MVWSLSLQSQQLWDSTKEAYPGSSLHATSPWVHSAFTPQTTSCFHRLVQPGRSGISGDFCLCPSPGHSYPMDTDTLWQIHSTFLYQIPNSVITQSFRKLHMQPCCLFYCRAAEEEGWPAAHPNQHNTTQPYYSWELQFWDWASDKQTCKGLMRKTLLSLFPSLFPCYKAGICPVLCFPIACPHFSFNVLKLRVRR